jgi:hypothetical protein
MGKSVIIAVKVMEDAPNKEQIEKLLSENTHVVKKDIPELDDREVITINNDVGIDINPHADEFDAGIYIEETEDLSR